MELLGPQPGWIDSHNGCSFNPDPCRSPIGDCKKSSAVHIRLADDQGYVSACVEHQAFALGALSWTEFHSWMAWCNMPGALWFSSPTPDEADSYCALDDGGEEPVLVGSVEMFRETA